MQADTLFLCEPSGRWPHQLTVCGLVSKLAAVELVTTPLARNMRAAFERILGTFPVVIQGGRPTTAPSSADAFEELFQEHGMAMQVLQPRIPKQNGCVGRCQRTWRKERYETSSVAATLDGYRRDARHLVVHRNHVRPHAAPSGRTPIGYLREHHGESLRRNLAAPAGKPMTASLTKNAGYSDCVRPIESPQIGGGGGGVALLSRI